MNFISPILITGSFLLLPTITVFSQEVEVELPTPPTVSYWQQLDEGNEKEILAKLPEELKRDLLKVKEVDEDRYRELLMESSFGGYDVYFGYMEEFEKKRYETEKKVQQLEVQTEALGIRYEHAGENEKSELVNRLRQKLEDLFEMKEKSRAYNVEMLERELAELKESLTIRKQNKKEIINRRLNELIGKGDYLDW